MVFLIFFLAGCENQPLTYHYLMRHPAFLEKEMSHCQIEIAESSRCQAVKQAANDFDLLVTERETNPEQFGEKIMRAEEQLANQPSKSEAYQSQFDHLQILLAVLAFTGMK
jgi:hypothetical protein